MLLTLLFPVGVINIYLVGPGPDYLWYFTSFIIVPAIVFLSKVQCPLVIYSFPYPDLLSFRVPSEIMLSFVDFMFPISISSY